MSAQVTDRLGRVIYPGPWFPASIASAMTGLSESDFRSKARRGVWVAGREYRETEGGLEVNIDAFERWVEGGERARVPALAIEPARRRPPSPGPTKLYRHFDAEGRLLYVGISLGVLHRLAQHMNGSHWAEGIARVEVESFPTRGAALAAERTAIRTEQPLHNVVHAEPERTTGPDYAALERYLAGIADRRSRKREVQQ